MSTLEYLFLKKRYSGPPRFEHCSQVYLITKNVYTFNFSVKPISCVNNIKYLTNTFSVAVSDLWSRTDLNQNQYF